MEERARLAGPLPAWLADDVALLLRSEGIEPESVGANGGTFIVIAARDLARATHILGEEYPEGLVAAVARRRPVKQDQGDAAPVPDRWFGPGSWVLVAFAAACVAVFAIEESIGGSETRSVLLRVGASRPAHVRSGEWWRLVTALFVHIGPRHLLGNLAALAVLGPALAAALGPGRFAFIYVLAGTAGNALSYQIAPSDTVSAGASGAILGLLGALGGQRLRFAPSARYRGWQVVAALLAYLAIAVGAEPGVDTMAHLGGLAAGFALGFVVPPAARMATVRDRTLSLACGAVALAIILAAFTALVVSASAASGR